MIDKAVALREQLNSWNDPAWHAGSAEPWIANLLQALILANDPHTAIEVGGFEGYTSVRLALALAELPHNTELTVCEIDADRALAVQVKLDALWPASITRCKVVHDDSLRWLPTLAPRSIDFAWLDGNHELAHVDQETQLLWPAMRQGGLICYHDVFGVCQLDRVVRKYGGYSLDLPRLGPAGGLGIIQVR